jgi:predicted dehydrogenase
MPSKNPIAIMERRPIIERTQIARAADLEWRGLHCNRIEYNPLSRRLGCWLRGIQGSIWEFSQLQKATEAKGSNMVEPKIAATLANAKPAMPKNPRPIVLIGAGGIARDAHLPAYQKAGFPVAAVVDTDLSKAQALARQFKIAVATDSIETGLRQAPAKSIFDIAVPASALLHILPHLPKESAVLMQKPMGDTLEDARAILALCRNRGFTAAVNFQLRWSPVTFAARQLALAGHLGKIHDMEVQVSVHTPWELWTFLKTAPRLEILYHSIHYIDLVRAWFGDPQTVFAKTVRSPRTPELAATKTVMILDYGDWTRVYIATNHSHAFGSEMQRSYVQWEGTEGAARATMGVNLNYPVGEPDVLKFAGSNAGWQVVPTQGNWFPDAFMGSMGSLQAYVDGVSKELPTSVENAIGTMRVVEAAYLSSERGGVALQLPELAA